MWHEWRERVMLRLAKRFTTWGMIALQQLAPKLAALPVEEQRKRFFLLLLLLILTPTLMFFIWVDLQDVGLTIAVILEMIALVLNIIIIFATIGTVQALRSIYRVGILYTILLLLTFVFTGASPTSYVWFYFVPLATYFLLGHREGSLWVLLSWLLSLAIISFPIGLYRYSAEVSLRFDISYTIVCILAYGMELSRHRYYGQLLAEKRALEAALQQVNTLQDLLPICAACKKIRDDGGYWHQVESYMHRHAGVEFSHSICPECRTKLYPTVPTRGAPVSQSPLPRTS